MFAAERTAIAVALIAAIGLGDRVTGADLAFTLLYLVPVGMCAWWSGIRTGIAMAVLAAACSAANMWHDGSRLQHLAWNEVGELVIFVGAAYLVNRLRRYIDQERAQKHAIVDQLRHADRLNVIGTLAAGVAHEIGTPLNVISGSAELMVDAPPDELPAIARTIGEQATRISSIVQHLLDFGRRAGTGRTPVDLNAIATSSTRLLAPMARKRGTELVVETAPAAVTVRGNASELEQVLSNLVLNAIQAMPPQGGQVTLRVAPSGSVTVEDTGVGIPAESLAKIFDPFFTTKGIGEGTGLGLSVSYGIVHDHDGAIDVDSVVGRGTRFTVQLPLAEVDSPRQATRALLG